MIADRWQNSQPTLATHVVAATGTGFAMGSLYGGLKIGQLWAGLALGTTVAVWLTQDLWRGMLQRGARSVVHYRDGGSTESQEVTEPPDKLSWSWFPSWMPIRPVGPEEYKKKLQDELQRLEMEEQVEQTTVVRSEKTDDIET